MTSETFTKFVDQFNSKGRQHGEGYSQSHFSEMSDEEKSDAASLLEKSANNGDTTAIQGLSLLNTNKSIDILKKFASSSHINSITILSCSELFKKFEDDAFVDKFLEAVKSNDASIIWLALNNFPDSIALIRHRLTEASTALISVVLNNDDMILRSVAIKKLWLMSGLSKENAFFKSALTSSMSENLQDRIKAIDLLRKEASTSL